MCNVFKIIFFIEVKNNGVSRSIAFPEAIFKYLNNLTLFLRSYFLSKVTHSSLSLSLSLSPRYLTQTFNRPEFLFCSSGPKTLKNAIFNFLIQSPILSSRVDRF